MGVDHHLLEYERKLQEVYALCDHASLMDLSIPMELFVLDCTNIKQVRQL